ncbi:hypothetical protein AB0G74_28180 [Streptomyces sp. NPDC020875]|uniref:hypothetical protein n=1 Tax=Streptomyces sp. NPDC020875 TaxID=3154898 RepID=UPI0033F51D8F
MAETVGDRIAISLIGGAGGGWITAVVLDDFVAAVLGHDFSVSALWWVGAVGGAVVAVLLWFVPGPDGHGSGRGRGGANEDSGDGGGDLSCGDCGGCGGD